jgi:hypothetical protein
MNKKGFIWLMVGLFIALSMRGELSGKILGNVVVKVIDDETGEGIKGVAVLLGNEISGETDKNGKFVFKNIYPSDYCIRYAAPFPYVAELMKRDKLESPSIDCMTLEEGENKYIVKKLKKGGGVRGKIQLEAVERIDDKTVGITINIYKVEEEGEMYKDPVWKTEGMYEIDAIYGVDEDGEYEILGLPEGKLIIVVRGRMRASYEEEYDFPGKLKIVDIRKEELIENLDFYLEENKEESANLRLTVISSIDNKIFKDVDISVKKIVGIWEREFSPVVFPTTKWGEGAGILTFVLDPGKYILNICVVKHGLKFGDEIIEGENIDEKDIEVEIIEGLLKEITVYFNIKVDKAG